LKLSTNIKRSVTICHLFAATAAE